MRNEENHDHIVQGKRVITSLLLTYKYLLSMSLLSKVSRVPRVAKHLSVCEYLSAQVLFECPSVQVLEYPSAQVP